MARQRAQHPSRTAIPEQHRPVGFSRGRQPCARMLGYAEHRPEMSRSGHGGQQMPVVQIPQLNHALRQQRHPISRRVDARIDGQHFGVACLFLVEHLHQRRYFRRIPALQRVERHLERGFRGPRVPDSDRPFSGR